MTNPVNFLFIYYKSQQEIIEVTGIEEKYLKKIKTQFKEKQTKKDFIHKLKVFLNTLS